MDERRLSELFTEAAEQVQHSAPPPGFDHASVLANSRRATERARRWQTGTMAAAVVVVVGAGLTSIQLLGTAGRPPTTLAGPAPSASPAPAPRFDRAAPLTGPEVRSAPNARSGPDVPPGPGIPPGPEGERPGSSSCAQPDLILFSQLTAALPGVKGKTPRPPADDADCPQGARGVEVDVRDRGAPGVLRVLLSPPGAGGVTVTGRGRGSVYTTSARTRDGARLTVSVTTDAPGRIPYANRLTQLARTLAGHN